MLVLQEYLKSADSRYRTVDPEIIYHDMRTIAYCATKYATQSLDKLSVFIFIKRRYIYLTTKKLKSNIFPKGHIIEEDFNVKVYNKLLTKLI